MKTSWLFVLIFTCSILCSCGIKKPLEPPPASLDNPYVISAKQKSGKK